MTEVQLFDFEKLVLSAIIEGDAEETTLAEQLASATVENRDYTGVGLYTKLVVAPSAPRLVQPRRNVEEIPHLTHPTLSSGGGAMLWLSEGRADTLECYTYDGNWPSDESLFSVSR